MMEAQGLVPSLGNVAARYIVQGYEAALAGTGSAASRCKAKTSLVKEIYRVVAGDGPFDGFLAGMKGALAVLGVEVGPPAAPLRPCTPPRQTPSRTSCVVEVYCPRPGGPLPPTWERLAWTNLVYRSRSPPLLTVNHR